MKFFGWGRKKDPPPIQATHQDFKNSDAARSIQSPGAAEYRSDQLVGQEDQPHIIPSQRVALPLPWKDFFGEAGVDLDSKTWEEKLQDTIRFVFSHEQEGLLAIGTFALDQLAGVTHIDDRQNLPAATDHHNVNSRPSSVSSVQVVIREVRHSDDEIESQHSMRGLIPACKRKLELYPVFGDRDSSSSGLHCRGLSVGSTKPVTGKDHPSSTSSPNVNACTHEAGTKPRGETRGQADDPSTKLDHDQFDSEDFSSPGLCGLFASRSRRKQKGGGKEKRKKPPEKRKGNSNGSLGAQLGRLWRSGCTGSSASAKVSTEKKPISSPPADHRESQAQGPPCIANVEEAPGVPKPSQASKVGEQPKRRGHSFGKGWACAHNGNWIRTDSECNLLSPCVSRKASFNHGFIPVFHDISHRILPSDCDKTDGTPPVVVLEM